MSHPYVVVLILTYNGRDLLEESISSYLSNNYSNFDVVVIDNGSTDGTKEYVEESFTSAKVIRLEKNKGYSGGFNFGINYAINVMKADYVLVSNDDVWVDKSSIYQLVEVAESDNMIGFVTGKVYHYDIDGQRNILQTVGKKSSKISLLGNHIGGGVEDLGQFDSIEERDFCDDVFMLVRRKLIEDIGAYDETFYLQYEETDWQIRAKKKGFKIYYTPKAILRHKVGITAGVSDSPQRHFNAKRNSIILVKKHGNSLELLKYLFLRLFFMLPVWFLTFALRGRLDLIKACFSGTLSGFLVMIKTGKYL